MVIPKQTMDESEVETIRNADEVTRARLWTEWVDKVGRTEASRLWLVIFSATDAPKTG